MNTYAIAPSRQRGRRSSQSIDQEACELIFIHLAHAHRKVAVADPPGATDMAVDRNIVGRISADQVDGFIAEKHRIGSRFASIAADEFVTPCVFNEPASDFVKYLFFLAQFQIFRVRLDLFFDLPKPF